MPDFFGTDADEFLSGIDGTDRITGFGGNDTINGQEQEDVAVYRGNFDEYTVEFLNDGTVRITDSVADRDGTDILTSIEAAEFADQQVGLQTGQDVLFLFDHSGSMSDDIAAVLRNAQAVTEAIFNPQNGLLDSRVSVVSYERAPVVVQPFTTNPNPDVRQDAVEQALGNIQISGGIENLATALLHVLNGNAGTWREDATARRIFVFTDEDADDPQLLSQVYELAADVTQGEGETPLPVTVTTIALGGNRNVENIMRIIATNTGGEALTASGANDLVDVLLTALNPATDGPDAITGTVRDNVLDGQGGNDTLDAREGNDTLLGRDGDDLLTAGQGADSVWGGSGNDRIEAGAGTDRVSGGDGDDEIDGHRDNDLLRGNDGADTVRGGLGDDTVYGGRGADLLSGNQGNDTAYGGEGDDYVRGWGGNDRLEGGGGNDELESNQGDDILWGGRGFDTLNGGQDNDFLAGHAENDVLFGETGDDTLRGGSGDDALWGGNGIDRLEGGSGDDHLRGGNGTDLVFGGEGNDTLIGGTGADDLRGGEGADWVTYIEATQGVVASLSAQDQNQGAARGDTFTSIEILQGSLFEDILVGNDLDNRLLGAGSADRLDGLGGNDLLQGGWGADTILGGDGDDILHGQAGADSLTGGNGADAFVFHAGEGQDTITDFTLSEDVLRIAADLWTDPLDQTALDGYADTSSGTVVLDFGSVQITLDGLSDTTGLIDDIVLI